MIKRLELIWHNFFQAHPIELKDELGLMITFVGAILLLWQIASFAHWNRLTSAHTHLREVVGGQFSDLLREFALKYRWDIVREHRMFGEILQDLQEGQETDLCDELIADTQILLRILESICISIRHHIITETVCKEYFLSIFKSVYANSIDFIMHERELRREPKIFENFEHYALRWTKER